MSKAAKKQELPAPLDSVVIEGDAHLQIDFAEAQARQQQLQTLDQQYGDGQPYNYERVVGEIQIYIAQTVDAMLQLGKRLILLKEHEPQGRYLEALSRVGIEPRAAQRLVQAAIKYSNPQLQDLKPLGRTKLLELMVEEDEQLEALASGGTVAGLTLDEVDRMTSAELRAALREERRARKEGEETTGRLLADKNNKLDELSSKLVQAQQRVAQVSPDQEGNDLRTEATRFAFDAEAAIRGNLRASFMELLAHSERSDMTHAEFMAGCLAQLERAVAELRNEAGVFGQPGENDGLDFLKYAEDAEA